MIFFGAPRATGASDQALRCVRMALEVQERMQEFKAEFIRLSGTAVLVRIGIASGIATVGDFGAEYRTDFTVIGEPVNRAARIEPLAPPGSVLIDQQTQVLIADLFQCKATKNVQLKGFKDPQTIYQVEAEIQALQPQLVNF